MTTNSKVIVITIICLLIFWIIQSQFLKFQRISSLGRKTSASGDMPEGLDMMGNLNPKDIEKMVGGKENLKKLKQKYKP